MRSFLTTISIVVLASIAVLSFLLGWLGAGFTENFRAMWLLFGLGTASLVAAGILASRSKSKITMGRRSSGRGQAASERKTAHNQET